MTDTVKLSEEDQGPAQYAVYTHGGDMADAAQNEVNLIVRQRVARKR